MFNKHLQVCSAHLAIRLKFKSSVCFKVNFIGGKKYKSNFILLQVVVWFSQHLVHEQSFVQCMSCSLCQKYGGHTFVCLFVGPLFYSIALPVCFDARTKLFLINVALFYNLKLTIMIPPDVFSLFGITLAVCGLL